MPDSVIERTEEGPTRAAIVRETLEQPSLSNRSVLRACAILRCFERHTTTLGLAQISAETYLSKATAYRILTALVAGGVVERREKNTYCMAPRPLHRRGYRIGYAQHNEEFLFSRMVSESIRSSAYEAGVDLLLLNNRSSPSTAVRNADVFVREQVDLVVEFQSNQESAAMVADRLGEAEIPVIAIDVPHPGALFCGPNNYRAGMLGGHALAQACIARWHGRFDELLLLGLPNPGPLVGSRLTGIIAGLREKMNGVTDDKVRFLNGRGRFENSLEVVRKYLRHSSARRILIGTTNDPSCLGALSAFDEVGRSEDCMAVSHHGTLRARRELRRPGSSLIGAVGYFPEQYGEQIIRLALDRLQGREVPAATFIRHHLLNRENVDHFYPHDALLTNREGDSLLYSQR